MSASLASFFSAVFAFLWNVLSFSWPRRRTDTISPNSDLEAGCDSVIIEVAEAQTVVNVVHISGNEEAGTTHCPSFDRGADAYAVQESFLPSKLVEAIERCGTSAADTAGTSSSSVASVETNTSEDQFFSEGETMASSVTSVEEYEEVKDEEQVADVSGVKVPSGAAIESKETVVNEGRASHLTGSRNTSCILHGLPDRHLLAVSLDTKVLKALRPAHDPKDDLTVVLGNMGHCNFKLPATGVVDSSPEREAAEAVVSTIVQSPSSDATLARPAHPSRDGDEDLTDVLDSVDRQVDFELPSLAQPSLPVIGVGAAEHNAIMRNSSDIVPPNPLHPLHSGNEDPTDVRGFMKQRYYELPDLAQPTVIEAEDKTAGPVPSLIVQSPSSDEVPPRPVRPICKPNEDLTELLDFMQQHNFELPHLSGGNSVGPLSTEDEYEPIFDIIDNFDSPFEEGQERLVSASEWFADAETEVQNGLKSAWSEDSVPELEGRGGKVSKVRRVRKVGKVGKVGFRMRKKTPIVAQPRTVVPFPVTVQVVPQDYLQVPKRSYRRM